MCWVFPSCVWAKQAVLNELLQLDNQLMFTYGEVHISAKSSTKCSGKMWSTASRKIERRLSGGLPNKAVDCETASLFSETLTTNFNKLALLKNKQKSHRSYKTQTSSTIKDKSGTKKGIWPKLTQYKITQRTPNNCIQIQGFDCLTL